MAIDIQKNISLAPHTTFKIGGPAKEFVVVRTAEEIAEALTYAKKCELEVFLLGGGSNILVSDAGFDGLVIHLADVNPEVKETAIHAFAGTSLERVVNTARDASLSGLQNVAGVPGTVGGAVRGNAGAFGTEMKDVVSRVTAVHRETFAIQAFSREECHFSYRMSVFKEGDEWVVAEAVFSLEAGEKEALTAHMENIVAQRNAKQDQSAWCAGSFFVNPVVENDGLRKEFEQEVGTSCREGKVPAGWLIDRAGLRGKRIGGAMVSENHPNYILNVENATAEDVLILASYITQHVRRDSSVQLMQEVQYVGF